MQALRNDVAEALALTQKDVTINNVTKHIEIKVNSILPETPLVLYEISAWGTRAIALWLLCLASGSPVHR